MRTGQFKRSNMHLIHPGCYQVETGSLDLGKFSYPTHTTSSLHRFAKLDFRKWLMLPFWKFPEPPAAVSLSGKAAVSWDCCWKQSYPPYPSLFLSPLGCPSQKTHVSSPICFTIKLHRCLHWQKRWARERMAGGRNDFCQRQSWLETLSYQSQITAKILSEV